MDRNKLLELKGTITPNFSIVPVYSFFYKKLDLIKTVLYRDLKSNIDHNINVGGYEFSQDYHFFVLLSLLSCRDVIESKVIYESKDDTILMDIYSALGASTASMSWLGKLT